MRILSSTHLTILHLLSLSVSLCVVADTIPARSAGGCAYIHPQIYCYGGRSNISVQSGYMLTESIFYSLSLAEDVTVNDMQQKWKPLQREYPGSITQFSMTAIPDISSILIEGGVVKTNITNQPPKLSTALYNINTENWEDNSYMNSGHPQVSEHTATLGPGNTVYVWGGMQHQFTYESNEFSPLSVPLEMSCFNWVSKSWKTISKPPFKTSNLVSHAAALGKDGVSIYYIGGIVPDKPLYVNRTEYTFSPAPMNQFIIFNTINLEWKTRNTTGTTPTARRGHTLNLNPITGQLILFGGHDAFAPIGQTALSDYCYTIDTDTMVWNATNITAEDSTLHIIQVFSHSSIIVGKYLFILFGDYEEGGNYFPTNDTRVMDLEKMSWVPFFEAQKSGESNTGAIVGITVGSIGGAAIFCAIIFFLWRKRIKANQKPESAYKAGSKGIMIPSFDDDKDQHTSKSANVRLILPFNPDSSQEDRITYVPYSSDKSSISHVYGTEKPDAISLDDNQKAPRVLLTPVKPDGA